MLAYCLLSIALSAAAPTPITVRTGNVRVGPSYNNLNYLRPLSTFRGAPFSFNETATTAVTLPTSLAQGAAWFGAGVYPRPGRNEAAGDYWLEGGHVRGLGVLDSELLHADGRRWQMRCRARLRPGESPEQVIGCAYIPEQSFQAQSSTLSYARGPSVPMYLVLYSEPDQGLRGGFIGETGFTPIETRNTNHLSSVLLFGERERPFAYLLRPSKESISFRRRRRTRWGDFQGVYPAVLALARISDARLAHEGEALPTGKVGHIYKGVLKAGCAQSLSNEPQTIVPGGAKGPPGGSRIIPSQPSQQRLPALVRVRGRQRPARLGCQARASISLSNGQGLGVKDPHFLSAFQWLLAATSPGNYRNYAPLMEPNSLDDRLLGYSLKARPTEVSVQASFGSRNQMSLSDSSQAQLGLGNPSGFFSVALEPRKIHGGGLKLSWGAALGMADPSSLGLQGAGNEGHVFSVAYSDHLGLLGPINLRWNLGPRYTYASTLFGRSAESVTEAFKVEQHALGLQGEVDLGYYLFRHGRSQLLGVLVSLQLGLNHWFHRDISLNGDLFGPLLVEDLQTIRNQGRFASWAADITLSIGIDFGFGGPSGLKGEHARRLRTAPHLKVRR